MIRVRELIDFVLHFDHHLKGAVADYGVWMYAILFAIIFAETGLVVTPILPGDSLLFAAGALAAIGDLNIWVLCGLLTVAAILGDTVNYHIGKYLGPKVLRSEKSWLFNRKHITKTEWFFEKYGAKTIILARFVPIVRTFAPFVAGIGNMNYGKFLLYNVVGGVIWVFACTLAGYFLGQIDVIKKNIGLASLLIVAVSLIPIAVEFWLHRRQAAADKLDAARIKASVDS